jgi:hypothetical protein
MTPAQQDADPQEGERCLDDGSGKKSFTFTRGD